MNMLRITDLKIDNKSLGDKFLLVDISPAYEYKDESVRILYQDISIVFVYLNLKWKS